VKAVNSARQRDRGKSSNAERQSPQKAGGREAYGKTKNQSVRALIFAADPVKTGGGEGTVVKRDRRGQVIERRKGGAGLGAVKETGGEGRD